MKILFLSLALILFTCGIIYSDEDSKGQCFQVCQSSFRQELSKCRDNNTNTAIRTSCLDKARLSLNSCLEDCRDKYPDKLK
jgi:hypothetical protein